MQECHAPKIEGTLVGFMHHNPRKLGPTLEKALWDYIKTNGDKTKPATDKCAFATKSIEEIQRENPTGADLTTYCENHQKLFRKLWVHFLMLFQDTKTHEGAWGDYEKQNRCQDCTFATYVVNAEHRGYMNAKQGKVAMGFPSNIAYTLEKDDETRQFKESEVRGEKGPLGKSIGDMVAPQVSFNIMDIIIKQHGIDPAVTQNRQEIANDLYPIAGGNERWTSHMTSKPPKQH